MNDKSGRAIRNRYGGPGCVRLLLLPWQIPKIQRRPAAIINEVCSYKFN